MCYTSPERCSSLALSIKAFTALAKLCKNTCKFISNKQNEKSSKALMKVEGNKQCIKGKEKGAGNWCRYFLVRHHSRKFPRIWWKESVIEGENTFEMFDEKIQFEDEEGFLKRKIDFHFFSISSLRTVLILRLKGFFRSANTTIYIIESWNVYYFIMMALKIILFSEQLEILLRISFFKTRLDLTSAQIRFFILGLLLNAKSVFILQRFQQG